MSATAPNSAHEKLSKVKLAHLVCQVAFLQGNK